MPADKQRRLNKRCEKNNLGSLLMTWHSSQTCVETKRLCHWTSCVAQTRRAPLFARSYFSSSRLRLLVFFVIFPRVHIMLSRNSTREIGQTLLFFAICQAGARHCQSRVFISSQSRDKEKNVACSVLSQQNNHRRVLSPSFFSYVAESVRYHFELFNELLVMSCK